MAEEPVNGSPAWQVDARASLHLMARTPPFEAVLMPRISAARPPLHPDPQARIIETGLEPGRGTQVTRHLDALAVSAQAVAQLERHDDPLTPDIDFDKRG